MGSEAHIIKVSSPGAKKPQTLKDLLVEKVCKVSSNSPEKFKDLQSKLDTSGDVDSFFYDKC